jgi:hypothetical protein
VSMAGEIDRVEVITSVQRRRRLSAEEKARIVQERYVRGDVGVAGGAPARNRGQ